MHENQASIIHKNPLTLLAGWQGMTSKLASHYSLNPTSSNIFQEIIQLCNQKR